MDLYRYFLCYLKNHWTNTKVVFVLIFLFDTKNQQLLELQVEKLVPVRCTEYLVSHNSHIQMITLCWYAWKFQ